MGIITCQCGQHLDLEPFYNLFSDHIMLEEEKSTNLQYSHTIKKF
jgi:hypothetical protein